MLIAELFITALLALIALQDIKTRLVLWIYFPLLALLLGVIHWQRTSSPTNLWASIAFNLGMVIVMIFAIFVYFWITRKRIFNVIDRVLGWADILFLLSISFYFSPPDFIVFCIVSIFLSIIAWIIWQTFADRKHIRIPLVGFQAITLILFLSADWWFHLCNLTDDTWLYNLVNKWN